MKKMIPTLLAASLLLVTAVFRLEPAAADKMPFTDIASSYAKDAIIRLNANNVMKGTSETLFSPTRSITRAEFMTTLTRIFHVEPSASAVPAYRDVPKSAWYYGTIQAATELGLTEGLGDGIFKPNQPLTRQEAASWLVRALKQTATGGTTSVYKDEAMIAAWAKPSIRSITELGLMQGNDGRFYPTQPITRQETAVILDRLLQDNRWTDAIAASATPAPIQIGWQFGQSTEAYQKSILQSSVNVLAPRWYFLEKTGKISDSSVPSLMTWAKNNGKQVWAMVGNRFDQETTHKLLASNSLSSDAIQSLKSYVQKYGLHGINVDFENVAASDRDLFTAFIAKLAKELHTVSAVLSVDLPPDLGSDWSDAYNYAELAKSADYLVIMTYDEHWSGYTAGSVASLGWVESHLGKLLAKVSADQLILGMPLYTRDWTLSASGATVSSEDLTLPEQNNRVSQYGGTPKWNAAAGQYTMEYRKNGTQHKIWLEDARSLSAKYRAGAKYGVAGYAYWHIGGDSPDVWTSLKNAVKYEGYSFK
ncbi:MAG: S-layer homology domain-containing protein [Paenibacillus sp.]|uniref:S-layer homology domain-containing protein n=1 Tax=Paenibacillus sp. TaxID=58172 RepID=UPI0029113478|nr:S-layer homology domain-containing protein [Paenibacillus sp.]MDU4697335.1 S-layer homology domain-containing protein [Paenibacillus sp.]